MKHKRFFPWHFLVSYQVKKEVGGKTGNFSKIRKGKKGFGQCFNQGGSDGPRITEFLRHILRFCPLESWYSCPCSLRVSNCPSGRESFDKILVLGLVRKRKIVLPVIRFRDKSIFRVYSQTKNGLNQLNIV